MAKRTQSSETKQQRDEGTTAESSGTGPRTESASPRTAARRSRPARATSGRRTVPRRKRRAARATPKRGAASAKRAASSKARGRRSGKRGTGRRFTPAERTNILETARRDGLTGAQVQKRFGVSQVSYYLWRKKAGRTTAKASGAPRRGRGVRRSRGPGRPRIGAGLDLAAEVRRQVREQLARFVPQIVSGEMDQVFAGARRGRRRR